MQEKPSPPASNFWIKIWKWFQVLMKLYTDVWSRFWLPTSLQTFLSPQLPNFPLHLSTILCNPPQVLLGHTFPSLPSDLPQTRDPTMSLRPTRWREDEQGIEVYSELDLMGGGWFIWYKPLPSLYLGISGGHVSQLAQMLLDWSPTNSTKYLFFLLRQKSSWLKLLLFGQSIIFMQLTFANTSTAY